jgi:membrane-associated protease RseP (regulator of RpoE activity)
MNFVIVSALILSCVFHELGHAIVARRLGVRVKKISLFGMGPLIFSWQSKFFNGARIGFGIFPYGAYVLLDDLDLKLLSRKELDDISLAGPHMNFVLGLLATCLFMLVYGMSKGMLVVTCLCALLTLRSVKLFTLFFLLPPLALFLIAEMLKVDMLSSFVNDGFVGQIKTNNFFDFTNFMKSFLAGTLSMNIALGVLNMLPIIPLDGGHVAHRAAEKYLNKKGLGYKLLFIYLPLTFIVLSLLPVVGDIRKLISFLF